MLRKSYCFKCFDFWLTPATTNLILETPSWQCFFCSPSDFRNSYLQAQKDWEDNMRRLACPKSVYMQERTSFEKRPVRVLSLFDGISTGKVCLDMLGIIVDKYYACEIDEAAVNVSKFHHKNTINHLGNVCDITEDVLKEIGPIDLVIGGSPCNDLSLVNPARKGLYDFTSTGQLFFDYFHILNMIMAQNKDVFYLYENVSSMSAPDSVILSSFFMMDPVCIDAGDYSPQCRIRKFWGNIPGLLGLQDYWSQDLPNMSYINRIQQYILKQLGRDPVVGRLNTITTQRNSLIQEQYKVFPVVMNGEPDILWVTEIEKVFGFPMHYTDVGNLGISKRRELLGRSWSVPVIRTILQPLQYFFQCQ